MTPPDPAKVIAEALAEKLHWLADPERAQELAEAVLAALAAEGFPVGEPRDVEAIVEKLRRWGDYSLVGVPLDVAAAAVREAAQPDTVRNGVCLLCGSGVLLSGEHIRNEDCPAARPVPAPDNPPVTLAFWECGHIEVDRGRSHACPLDVCGATYAAYAPVADEDVIRADERERLSARVYENGWCPTCGKKAVVT